MCVCVYILHNSLFNVAIGELNKAQSDTFHDNENCFSFPTGQEIIEYLVAPPLEQWRVLPPVCMGYL